VRASCAGVRCKGESKTVCTECAGVVWVRGPQTKGGRCAAHTLAAVLAREKRASFSALSELGCHSDGLRATLQPRIAPASAGHRRCAAKRGGGGGAKTRGEHGRARAHTHSRPPRESWRRLAPGHETAASGVRRPLLVNPRPASLRTCAGRRGFHKHRSFVAARAVYECVCRGCFLSLACFRLSQTCLDEYGLVGTNFAGARGWGGKHFKTSHTAENPFRKHQPTQHSRRWYSP
jgi:hypothetical protein